MSFIPTSVLAENLKSITNLVDGTRKHEDIEPRTRICRAVYKQPYEHICRYLVINFWKILFYVQGVYGVIRESRLSEESSYNTYCRKRCLNKEIKLQ